MTDRELKMYARWRASSAIKFHSRPRTTVLVSPMSQRAYAAAMAVHTLKSSRPS